MAIHTSFLGATTVSGDEAKAFTRRLSHGRATKAASDAAINGRKMVHAFAKKGAITMQLDTKKRPAA
jgi:hypothetical protein